MRNRGFWVSLLCLSAFIAVGFQSLTVKGFTASVDTSARHGAVLLTNFEAVELPSRWADSEPSQDELDIYLPLTSNGEAAVSPIATATVTPTETSTVTPTVSPSPSPSPSPSATPIAEVVADLFVDDTNTTNIEDGSPEHPYANLQAAIDTVSGSEPMTIAVASGVYTENILIQDKTVHLYGGFVGGTLTDYTSGDGGDFDLRNPSENVTHLQGDKTDSVVTMLGAGASTVDGFRITDGARTVTSEFSDRGGGFFVRGGSPTISFNLIENNNTIISGTEELAPIGGGIYAELSDISILNNVIRNNLSGRGAGVGIDGGIIKIRGNIVQGNRGIGKENGDHGGGLYIYSPDAEISHNLIASNEIGKVVGYGWGGGIIVYGQGTIARLSYNVITDNYAPIRGNGVFIDEGAHAVLDHELIYNNQCVDNETAGGVGIYVDGELPPIGSHVVINHSTIADNGCNTTEGGNGLYVEAFSSAIVENSIFWGNNEDDFFVTGSSQITVTYTLSEEPTEGEGNLSNDPFFTDPAQYDYHLQSTAGRWDPEADGGGAWIEDDSSSPAIDAANPESPFVNEPSPNGGRANLGVYGNTAEASKSNP